MLEKGDRNTGRTSYEGEGKGGGKHLQSEETQRSPAKHQKQGERDGTAPPRRPQREPAHLDLRLPASKITRQRTAVV